MRGKNVDLMLDNLIDPSKTVAFTGHRPEKLYGYNLSNPKYQILAKKISEIVIKLITEKGVRNFITGAALGFDTVCFFAVEYAKKQLKDIKINNFLAIPYADFGKNWVSKEDKDRLYRMKDVSNGYIYIDTIQAYNDNLKINIYNTAKLSKRNEFLVDFSRTLVALTNNSNSGTQNCINYAIKYYQNSDKDYKIIKLHPNEI